MSFLSPCVMYVNVVKISKYLNTYLIAKRRIYVEIVTLENIFLSFVVVYFSVILDPNISYTRQCF